jgi:hypothetical protein
MSGTRETLLRTVASHCKERTYKPKGEVVSCGKGVGGGHSTDEPADNITPGREGRQ